MKTKWAVSWVGALLLSGCMQLETNVRLNEDGTATITERLNFSRRLLDMAKSDKAETGLESLLTKEAAQERLKHMGKGLTFVSHEARDGAKGSRESVAVYRAQTLEDVTLVSPFMAAPGWPHALHIAVNGCLAYDGGWEKQPGTIQVHFRPGPGAKRREPAGGAKPAETPSATQIYRDLSPVFRDLLRDFCIRLTFETYCPVHNTSYLAHRDKALRVNYVDILNVTDENLDGGGYPFFDNEEILVDMLRGKLSDDKANEAYSAIISQTLRGPHNHEDHMAGNAALPVFHQEHRGTVRFAPSAALFEKYLAGKTLDFQNGDNGGKKELANFDRVGWKPGATPPKETKVGPPDNCPTNCPWCPGNAK